MRTDSDAAGAAASGAAGAHGGGGALPTVLEGIVASRRTHLPEIRARIAHVDPEALPRSTRSLFDSLSQPGTSFIMECKSSSPSLGMIREDYRPGDIVRIYTRYASGISVLCEPERFGGDYDHLATVSASTHLPVLCKDFIVDEVQIHAARYFGADAILLMLSVLSDEEYAKLSAEADRLGLDVLTEVISEDEVARATNLGAKIFGVNHRDLNDLSIDLSRSARLAPLVPEGAVIVAESGIRDNRTVRSLSHADAFLVGSQLTSQPDIDLAARELVFGTVKVCGLRTKTAAQVARACGATWGGLVFAEGSPRNVSRETAKEIIAAESGLRFAAVSRETSGWGELVRETGVDAAQLHAPYQGSIEAEKEFIASVRAELPEGVEIWRAVSMSPAGESPTSTDGAGASGTASDAGAATPAEVAAALVGEVDRLVLDSGNGGTGSAFDWSAIPDDVKAHALLAGGLSPENLAGALEAGCAGVDLNSGFEYGEDTGTWAGHKDAARLRAASEIIRGRRS